jgi:type IV pilus assembly protein PilY1
VKPFSFRTLCASLAIAASANHSATAEDIDLFTSPSSASTQAPNVLIILDNSANWSRNDQGWPLRKQGESELRAIFKVLQEPGVGTNINLGLMMLTSGSPDGGYVRYHIRNMTAVHKKAFMELIGAPDAASAAATGLPFPCVDGPNSITGGANCILKNFDSPSEKTNSASTRYSAALFDAFKYFGGFTDPAHANNQPAGYTGENPKDRTHFGTLRYAVLDAKADRDAYVDAAKTRYNPPITIDNSCAKNFIIFIGNGYPSQDNDPSLLTGINGDAAVPPPVGNKANRASNWTKYLFTTDVNEAPGRQNVVTYTVNVFKDKEEADQTKLLQTMKSFGGGKYFEAKSEQAIVDALLEVIIEIQAVNSVFASASLPINATNRSQNENQVFIGMFRPDGDAKPRWYGNLKQFQIALFGGQAKLADKDGKEAVAATTGFIQSCATSFWTTDSANYWDFSPPSQGTCTIGGANVWSDLPDGGVVEKGGAAEVVRRGNDPAATAPFTLNRRMFTCSTDCGGLVDMTSANVGQARTGALTLVEHEAIINFTRGLDVTNENNNFTAALLPITDEPRPSIHGDIAHSRPLPVNYGSARGVVVYYGANDGTFKAVDGKTGVELWSFVAPEHHSKLKRLHDNAPKITYPGLVLPTARRKDYFFDGSAGLYQNGDDSKVWIFPTMRRGGRMLYAFNVTNPSNPSLLWAKGCPLDTTDDMGCDAPYSEIGQTWSTPNPAFIKGFNGGADPVLVMGGGYDPCYDEDVPSPACGGTPKGNRVYVIDAANGDVVRSFTVDSSAAADVTLIDRDFDGKVDHAYVADVKGNLYRVDFVDPISLVQLAPAAWTMKKIAYTSGANRKFLFGPSVIAVGDKVYLAIGSGDRERPLIVNYPYTSPVQNRFYMVIDTFASPSGPTNLDGADMENFTAGTDCNTLLGTGKLGWFMDLNAGRGEQTVTSSVIFGGTVFFSTNRPIPSTPGSCVGNLGEARGYAVNLLNASGVVGSGKLCGGDRSGVFTGGGIPPSPVVGTVPVRTPSGDKPISVLIGGIDLTTGTGSPIGAQEPPVPVRRMRSRIYWYPHGDR